MAFMAAALPSLLGGIAATMITQSLLKKDAPQPQAAAAAAPAAAPIAPPAVEPPIEMPSPTSNSQEARAAARRSIAVQMARPGRASTILTDNADAKLGG